MENQIDAFNQTDQPSVQTIKIKAPLFVTIVAWILLLGGIGKLLLVLPFMLVSPALGLLQLSIAVGLIAVSFGIRHMRKWALYAFTAIAILTVIITSYDFLTSSKKELSIFVDVAGEMIILIYFWAISKKFT